MITITQAHIPIKYYCWLRANGYSPRNAAASTLAHFCKSADDLHRRMNRWHKRGGRH